MLDVFKQHLQEKTGIQLKQFKEDDLNQLIDKRMLSLGMNNLTEYYSLYSKSVTEQKIFFDFLPNHETWFLRDPQGFSLLQTYAAYKKKHNELPLRLLSIGCSSGEEVYSMLCSLVYIGFTPNDFFLEGLDLSTEKIKQAEQGIYTKHSFKGDSQEKLHFFLQKLTDQSAQIQKRYRDLVRFRRCNILFPDFLTGKPSYDVIFCKYVGMYFTESARETLKKNLDHLLVPKGLLIVGSCEVPLFPYTPIHKKGTFALYKGKQPLFLEQEEKLKNL